MIFTIIVLVILLVAAVSTTPIKRTARLPVKVSSVHQAVVYTGTVDGDIPDHKMDTDKDPNSEKDRNTDLKNSTKEPPTSTTLARSMTAPRSTVLTRSTQSRTRSGRRTGHDRNRTGIPLGTSTNPTVTIGGRRHSGGANTGATPTTTSIAASTTAPRYRCPGTPGITVTRPSLR